MNGSPSVDLLGNDISSDSLDGDQWEEEDAVQVFLDREKESYVKKRHFKHKLVFTLGVLNIIALSYGVWSDPTFLLYYFTATAPLLIFWRLYDYWKNMWQFFLIDFCYFANTLMMIFIWAYPDSPRLFFLVFAASHGPLLWALLAFNNSLVFHSVDKLTSVYIHAVPALVSYSIRWNAKEINWYTDFKTCLEDEDELSCDVELNANTWLWSLGAPALFFLAHSIWYYLVVEVVLGSKVKADKRYLTSFRHLVRDPKSLPARFVFSQGKRMAVVMYGLMQETYTIINCIPVIFMLKWQLVNVVFVLFMLVGVTWNGANFYIEVFSRRYTAQVQKQAVRKAESKMNARQAVEEKEDISTSFA